MYMRRTREDSHEDGFTFLELLVVVAIIAILLTMAVPTFLRARSSAQDRAAQTSARVAVMQARVIFAESENFGFASEIELDSAEPSLDFLALGSESQDATDISFVSPSRYVFRSAGYAASDRCWHVQDVEDPNSATPHRGVRWAVRVSAGSTCNAGEVVPAWYRTPGDALSSPF